MKKSPYWGYLGYGLGALGMDLSYGLFFTFASFYLTDILFLSPIVLMGIIFAARVWDGFNDPMMGAIVDRTRSRFGKYRPWMVAGSVSNALVLVMLFTNPGFTLKDPASPWLYAYVALAYVLWDMTNTMMDIPYWSMVPSLTSDPKRRNIVATIPRAFSGLGQGVVGIASPLMIPLLGGQEGLNAKGYSRWAAICGLGLILLVMVAFFSTGKIKAVAQDTTSQEKITARMVIDALKHNDQLLIFMLVALLANTGWYLVNGLATYYFEHVLGNVKLMSQFSMLIVVGQAAGLLLLPVLTLRLKRNTVIKLAMGMAGVGYLGMYLFSETAYNYPLFLLSGFVGMMGVGCCFVSQTIMLSDIVDYGEHKLGYRSDSVVFSMKGFLQKGAYSLQAIIMNAGLHFTHYNGKLEVQPQSAKTGITVMMFLLPPALIFLSLLLFSRKYKLDEGRMQEINAGKIAAEAEA